MDADSLISVAHTLTIAGAVVLVVGLLTMAWPISAIGLGKRRRGGLVMLAGLCIAFGGVALLHHVCDPTILVQSLFGKSTPADHSRARLP